MPSIKDLKKRIGSVKNTQQTTRALKMVSAAKLRRAQEAIQNQRPYARKVGDLISLVSALGRGDPAMTSPVMTRAEVVEGKTSRKVLLVVVTSDRGLCGGFNSSVIKGVQRWVRENKDKYNGFETAFVGKKGYDFFRNKHVNLRQNFAEVSGRVTFAKAKVLSDTLVDWFLHGEVDEVKFIFNEFKNAVTQKVLVEDFLPIPQPTQRGQGEGGGDLPMYLAAPAVPALLEQLLARNFAIQAFRILLESQASEHGARMSAMENATKNASEMIRKLTLQYNKQRQAGITKELLEIIAGSESQKGSG